MIGTNPLRKLGLSLCLIAGLVASGSGFAQDGGVEIDNAVYKEIDVTATDGTVTRKLVPAVKVVPGGEVIYEITYRNNASEPATDVNITNPLPKEVVFVSASVEPTAVSVDGGREFGQLEELTVEGPDGQVRRARAADINSLRWIVPSLAAGASGKVTFRARVK